MAESKAALSHPHPHFPQHPYGLHLWDAAPNFNQPWLMNWHSVGHGACPCGAKLLRIGAASRAKLTLWAREQSQPSWLHTVPFLQGCSERMAQGRDTHSNHWLGWNPTPALTVSMSEHCWHEININAWKGTSEGCALSCPCLAASQDHSWISSCVPALKHCQARSLFLLFLLAGTYFPFFHTSAAQKLPIWQRVLQSKSHNGHRRTHILCRADN